MRQHKDDTKRDTPLLLLMKLMTERAMNIIMVWDNRKRRELDALRTGNDIL